jgi:very-short-patch-repair endonuclease
LENRKFRRQHSIENYILDFYCPQENLAVELDGDIHNGFSQRKHDKKRDAYLESIGIKVLRFENKFVFENPAGLLKTIKNEFVI